MAWIMNLRLPAGLLLLASLTACGSVKMAPGMPAKPSAIFTRAINAEPSLVYDAVYHSLEASQFVIVAEPDIGKTLARNAERWGENYNRNDFDSIRSMVFCSPWYANEFSNVHPALLAFCPFNVTLLSSSGVTTVLFVRPSSAATTGAGAALAREVESIIVTALDRALDELNDEPEKTP